MAENSSGANNEMGKLFVDIGIGGLGKALKSLNSVSASFLLGKNAAMQFAQTISQPFKEAGKGAIEIGKMSNALATSSTEFQKLALYLKNFNMSDALIGDVSKLQKTFLALRKNQQNMSDSWRRGFAEAHLDPMQFNGTFEGAMKFLDELQKKTTNMSKENRNFILDLFGLNNDWGYLWDKGGRAGDYLTISDEELGKLQSMQETIENAKNSLETLMSKYLSVMSPAIENIANWLTGRTKYFVEGGGVETSIDTVKGAYNASKPKNIHEAVVNSFMPIIPATRAVVGGIKAYKNSSDGNPMGGAAPIFSSDIEDNASLPPNLSNMTQNITNNITHDITINGDNAQAVANRIAGLSEQDIQYSQYQAANLPGI